MLSKSTKYFSYVCILHIQTTPTNGLLCSRSGKESFLHNFEVLRQILWS